MYVIKSNQKMSLYLGFADGGNALNDTITTTSQGPLECALHFKTEEDAKKFLYKYFDLKKDVIKESNKKYYKIEYFEKVQYIPTANIFLFDVPCYFSTEAYYAWRRHPNKFKKEN